jgi:hypothetical protein
MLGSVGGVFSASEFGNLGFEVDFRLEENDLGRWFLVDDVEDEFRSPPFLYPPVIPVL